MILLGVFTRQNDNRIALTAILNEGLKGIKTQDPYPMPHSAPNLL